MRIVFFQFVPHFGGAARSCIELARRLKSRADVTIVDPYGCAEAYAAAARDAGLAYHVVLPGGGRPYIGARNNPLKRVWRVAWALPELLQIQRRAGRLITSLDPAVICCDNFKSAFVVGTSPSLRHVPVVPLLRGWYIPSMVPPYARWLCRHRCVRTLAVSHATRSALICSSIPAGRIRVIQNPIDVALVARRAEAPPTGPLPQLHRPVRLLLPAGIMREKGQHTAVEALGLLVQRGHDAVLWLAGDHQAVEANRGYVVDVKALAARLGVEDRVEWLGLRNDVPQLMRAATVVMLPSHREGHPRVILEAMALGRPVCATPAGGILDMILDGFTGLLHDFDDGAGLAACIERFSREPAEAEAMAVRAQEHVRQCFRPEQHTERLLELLQEAASAGRG